MREWKDEGIVKFNPYQKLMFASVCSLVGFLTTLQILQRGSVNGQDIFNIGCLIFTIWGIFLDGFPRVVAKLRRWEMKKRDNHWRNNP